MKGVYTPKHYMDVFSLGNYGMQRLRVLMHEGYTPSPTNPCIFQHANDDKIYFLILYVDSILLFTDVQEIERVKSFMMREI